MGETRDPQVPAEALVEQVSARAALAGNPSDGYGGAVFAVPVDAMRATVTLRRASEWTIVDEVSGGRAFSDVEELRASMAGVAATEPHALALATLAHFIEQAAPTRTPLSIEVTSTIPVSVGLAGSSAIVLGLLRALHRASSTKMPTPLSLAEQALEIETRRLGIAAGMQDRLVQSYGRPVLMRFDRPLGGRPGERVGATSAVHVVEPRVRLRLMVAHRAGLAEPSQIVHGDLRRRFDEGDAAVRAGLRRLATHAVSAGAAFEEGDAGRLGRAMDATFETRAQMIDLTLGHVEMITAAQAAGASANYTGSGGAIVVLSADESIERTARQSLKRLGCEISSVDVEADAAGGSAAPA